MKRKQLVLLAFLLTVTVACNDEFKTPLDCIDASQTENTSWFKEYTAQFDDDPTGYNYLAVATYEFQTVYLPGNCCPNCLTLPVVLNCQGEHIGVIGNGDGDIDPAKLKNVEIIWRSPNYSCTN